MKKLLTPVFAFFAITLMTIFAFAQDLSQTLPVEDAFRGMMAQVALCNESSADKEDPVSDYR
jgi:hypothetical protein